MHDPNTMLIGWTVVYTDESDGVTWVAPWTSGQGNFYGRVFTKSEAEHRAIEVRKDNPNARVVAVYS